MVAYLVTRHDGAVRWAARQGFDARPLLHLDPGRVHPGDVVMGTLPIQLVATINARGARYLHLELDLPEEARGRELDADEMERFGARLIEYRVARVDPHRVTSGHAGSASAGGGRS